MPEGVEIKPKVKKGPRTPKGKGKGSDDDEPAEDGGSAETEGEVKKEDSADEITTPRQTTARQRSNKRKSVDNRGTLKEEPQEQIEEKKPSTKRVSQSAASFEALAHTQPPFLANNPNMFTPHLFLLSFSRLHPAAPQFRRSASTGRQDRADRGVAQQAQTRPQLDGHQAIQRQKATGRIVRLVRRARMMRM